MKPFFFFLLLSTSTYGQADTVTIYFEFDSHEIMFSEEIKLSELSGKKSITLTAINAHCDTVGTKKYNLELAKNRLAEVESYFSGRLVQNTMSFGEDQAVVSPNYIASKYRKVDIVYEVDDSKGTASSKESREPAKTTSAESMKLVQSFTEFLKDSTAAEITIQLSILFYSNSDMLYPESEPELFELFDFMHYNQNITAHIRGHVCCGDDYLLSSNRAYKIYRFLKDRSISPTRMTFRGYSNKRPFISPELTDEDRKKNRRVDVIFTKIEQD